MGNWGIIHDFLGGLAIICICHQPFFTVKNERADDELDRSRKKELCNIFWVGEEKGLWYKNNKTFCSSFLERGKERKTEKGKSPRREKKAWKKGQ